MGTRVKRVLYTVGGILAGVSGLGPLNTFIVLLLFGRSGGIVVMGEEEVLLCQFKGYCCFA